MAPDKEQYDASVALSTPLGRDQQPSEIADTVAFLCSERASSITGQVVAIDGGLTAGPPIVGTWELGNGDSWPPDSLAKNDLDPQGTR